MTERPTAITAADVHAVASRLVDAIHGFVPGTPRAQLAPLGDALADMFGLFTQIGAENVAPFASQQVLNMQEIERIKGRLSDLRTVQGDLMTSRNEMEARIAALETQVAKLMEEGQP